MDLHGDSHAQPQATMDPAGPVTAGTSASPGSSSAGTGSAASPSSRKRTWAQSQSHDAQAATAAADDSYSSAISVQNRRRLHKVSRACDICKAKKARCSGTLPCATCSARGLRCLYGTRYSRGRPPTPPPAAPSAAPPVVPAPPLSGPTAAGLAPSRSGPSHADGPAHQRRRGGLASGLPRAETDAPSRASPEVDMAEMEGQYFDPSSGLTFLHRALSKLAATSRKLGLAPHHAGGHGDHQQPLTRAGDRSFVGAGGATMPSRQSALELVAFYFDVCVVTYRIFHRPTVIAWLDSLLSNVDQGLPLHHGIGHDKAAIILTIFAISTLRGNKVSAASSDETLDDADLLAKSDPYFVAAAELTEAATGLPRLESAQARLLQVLYLLQTSRMNQAWYVFGTTSQIIYALGLHRRAGKKRHNLNRSRQPRPDYINAQCRKRTFWAAYIVDKYLSVVLGRPVQHRDEDIDQEFPDSVNDEDMTPQGPPSGEAPEDCHLDAMIFHAKIAQIIGLISREVYSIKPIATRERVAAAHRASRQLHEWRESLPSHLGRVKPSTLVPSFRRQAIALKLAYSHAIIHANRPFLLGQNGNSSGRSHERESNNEASAIRDSVAECISAARAALEIVDGMAKDGTLFHAFWWTSYVTFCALAVVYVWEIQRRGRASSQVGSGMGAAGDGDGAAAPQFPDSKVADLAELAERCRLRLGRGSSPNSPERRYSVVLEELRLEARRQCPSAAPRAGPAGEADADVRGIQGDGASLPRNGGDAPPVVPLQQPPQSHHLAPLQQPPQQQQDPSYATIHDSALDQAGFLAIGGASAADGFYTAQNMLDGWQTTDWLDLDSSAFGLFAQSYYGSPEFWDVAS